MKARLISLLFLSWCACCTGQGVSVDSLKSLLPSSKEDTLKVNLLFQISRFYLSTEPKSAIPFSTQAKELSAQLNYQKGLAVSYKFIGLAYYQQSQYIEAMDNWNHSLEVFQKMNDKVGIANLQNNIGVIYKDQGNDSKALEFF